MSLFVHVMIPVVMMCYWVWQLMCGQRRRDREGVELSRRKTPLRLINVASTEGSSPMKNQVQSTFFDLGVAMTSAARGTNLPKISPDPDTANLPRQQALLKQLEAEADAVRCNIAGLTRQEVRRQRNTDETRRTSAASEASSFRLQTGEQAMSAGEEDTVGEEDSAGSSDAINDVKDIEDPEDPTALLK
mmetsp:Transcript_41132/g.76122  ORF Transcript_41132/g.76122 Transcript_41132/m.76122 type:complete len:189 (+) Transcript_41132:553-1119(+)